MENSSNFFSIGGVVSRHTTSIQSPSDLEIGQQMHSEGTRKMLLMWSFVCFKHLILLDWEINKQIKTNNYMPSFFQSFQVCALGLLFFIHGVWSIYIQTQSSLRGHNFIELRFPDEIFFIHATRGLESTWWTATRGRVIVTTHVLNH